MADLAPQISTEPKNRTLKSGKAEIGKIEYSKPKQKVEIRRAGMNKDRLSEEFRNRRRLLRRVSFAFSSSCPSSAMRSKFSTSKCCVLKLSSLCHSRETSRARSNEEFVSELGGALKEQDVSLLWLGLLREDCGIVPTNALPMEKEANELTVIMTTMVQRIKAIDTCIIR